MKSYTILRFILLAFLAFLMVLINSCRSHVNLTPAPEASELEKIDESAVSSVAGVSVIVQAQAWDGTTMIKEQVTPLKVTIKNNSGKSIKLRYSDFALVSNKGEHFAALPPYEIEDTIQDLRPQANNGLITPDIFYERFSIAPYYSPRYEGFEAFDGHFHYDPPYYERYYSYWAETPLPTVEMLQKALPDGVLENNGKVIGFLYFEAVPSEIQKVTFRMNVIDAKDGNVLGSISIPFITY